MLKTKLEQTEDLIESTHQGYRAITRLAVAEFLLWVCCIAALCILAYSFLA